MVECAFGIPVFIKGPHNEHIVFNSEKSFGHYNPFESPTTAMCSWYFLALLSNEISLNNRLKLV